MNTPGTLIYTNAAGISRGPTEPVAGNYYYGLFTASADSTDPSLFVFAGIYATNQAAPGRLTSFPVPQVVPGWVPGATKAFMVRGWSAGLGHDWTLIQQQLNTEQWSVQGFYGQSAIATGIAGGDVGSITYPALGIFGGLNLPGFDLDLVVPTPRLTIGLSDSDATLKWPASATGFTLQSTTNLTLGLWTAVSPAPVVVDGQNSVSQPVGDTQRFYRLSR